MSNALQGRSGDAILKAARTESRRRLTRRWLSRLCATAAVVGILNFLLFIAGTFFIGGDAINGKTENGRFYVWGYHNGSKQFTEVSRSTFEYSRWHCYTVFATWPLAMLAGLVLSRIPRED